MSKRLNKLVKEMDLSPANEDYIIMAQDIKNKVNEALNTDLEERKSYMRQRFLKTVVTIAVITVLTTTTAFAALNIDLLRTFFTGDTSFLEDFVKTPQQSVTDGRFTLTLEQVIASKYQVLVIYSVEGLTDDAIRELMSDGFVDIDTISFGPDNRKNTEKFDGFESWELAEKRTTVKRYWAVESSDVLNTNESDFFIRLNKMKNPQKIIVPMKCNVETKELVFAGQPYGKAMIKFSPLGIIYEKGISDMKELPFHTDVFFRQKSGEIKTFNELLELKGGGAVNFNEDAEKDAEYHRYEYNALFREIHDLSEFRSVIIGNIEYDIKNTSKTKPVKIDKHLYPFELKPAYKDVLWLPVNEFSQKIGADYKWDDKSRSATIKYRGSKYVITDGSDVVIKDGNEIKLEEKPFVLDGKLVAPGYILDEAFHMTIDVKKNDSQTDVKDWVWIITP